MAKQNEKSGPKIDPRISALLALELGEHLYQVEEIVWMDPDESQGLHHIFVDVLDEQGHRLAGEKFRVSWPDGELVVPIEEKPGETWGGNFPMYATIGSYSVSIVSPSGASDVVGGLGMGTPEDPGTKHHTSFGLKFVQRSEVVEPSSPDESEPTGETESDQEPEPDQGSEPQESTPDDEPSTEPKAETPARLTLTASGPQTYSVSGTIVLQPSGAPGALPEAFVLPEGRLAPGLESFGFLGMDEGVADVRDKIVSSVQAFVERMTQAVEKAMTEVTTLEVLTYTSDDLAKVKKEDLEGTATLHAVTRIEFDGDIKNFVPTRGGQIDQDLWALHLDMVQQAQTNRAELIRTAVQAISGLVKVV